jgi:hypothetical protein
MTSATEKCSRGMRELDIGLCRLEGLLEALLEDRITVAKNYPPLRVSDETYKKKDKCQQGRWLIDSAQFFVDTYGQNTDGALWSSIRKDLCQCKKNQKKRRSSANHLNDADLKCWLPIALPPLESAGDIWLPTLDGILSCEDVTNNSRVTIAMLRETRAIHSRNRKILQWDCALDD